MHRSSESVAALAAALAKAQAELGQSGEVADRHHPHRPARGRASAASAMRRSPAGSTSCASAWASTRSRPCRPPRSMTEPGLISLTTMLAHASGEWIASDWPVCPIGETATPHRMGAALTYARRYALFTLVGIAGEDDLDAPDLERSRRQSRSQDLGCRPAIGERGCQSIATGADPSCPEPGVQTNLQAHPDAEQSAELRDALIAEIERLGSADDAAEWARESLLAKNTLTAADANAVERAFRGEAVLHSTRPSPMPLLRRRRSPTSRGGRT